MAQYSITPESINSIIALEQYHVFPGTTLTACCLTLENGFSVVGHSACVDPSTFNEITGQVEARKVAYEKIWELEGYLVKELMARQAEDIAAPRILVPA